MLEVKKIPFRYTLVSERTIMWVISINAILIFLYSFPQIDSGFKKTLLILDNICAIYFILEVVLKIQMRSFRLFWRRAWDRFDLILVVVTLPAFFEPFVPENYHPALMSLSLVRILRFLKFLKFIPNSKMLIEGLKRALKASVGVGLSLLVLNIVFALGATILFGKTCPELFGDPLISMYSMFRVFTIEGWHEVPAQIISHGGSDMWIFTVRAYFVLSVSVGGLLGLSLANAIFVDEMTIDNNQKLERLIRELSQEVRELRADVKKSDENEVKR